MLQFDLSQLATLCGYYLPRILPCLLFMAAALISSTIF